MNSRLAWACVLAPWIMLWVAYVILPPLAEPVYLALFLLAAVVTFFALLAVEAVEGRMSERLDRWDKH